MPIIPEDTEVIGPLSDTMRHIVDRPDHPLHDTSKAIWAAGWGQTITGSALRWLNQNRDYSPDFNYRVFEDPAIKTWTKKFPGDFEEVFSRKQADDVIARIEKNREERRILAEGGGTGLMISLATGVGDPLPWLIPVGWVGKVGKAGQVVAKAALAEKVGGLIADDAVRLGVQLTDQELAVLARGVPKTDVVAQETTALLNIGMRRAERERVRAVAQELAAEKGISSVRRVREAQEIAGKTGEEALAAMDPLERANFMRSLETAPVSEALGLARTLEAGVRMDELHEALGKKYLARQDFADLTKKLENLGERRLAAEIAGAERLAATQVMFDSSTAKIATHKTALESARRAASEGLPSSLQVAGRLTGVGALTGVVAGGASEAIMQALQEGRERELYENSILAGGILGALLGGFGGALAGLSQRRLNQTHLALVEELTSGDLFARMPEVQKLTAAEMRAAANGTSGGGQPVGGVAEAVIDKVKANSPSMGKLMERESSWLRRGLRHMTLSPGGENSFSASIHAQQHAHSMLSLPYVQALPDVQPSAHSRITGHSQVAAYLATNIYRMRGPMDGPDFSRAVANVIRSGEKHANPAVNTGAEMLSRYFGEWDAKNIAEGLYKSTDLGADKGYFPRVYRYDKLEETPSDFIDRITPYVGRERAKEITDEMVLYGKSMAYDPLDFVTETGHLKQRDLQNVPSHVIADYLEDDLLYITERYARRVGSQYEAVKLQKTGTITERLNHTEWRRLIEEDYKALLDAAKSDRQRARIQNEFQKTIRNFEYINKSVLGFLNRDPFESGARAWAHAITLTGSFMFLGNAGFRSIGDAVAPAFVNGAEAYFQVSAARMARNLRSLSEKVDKNELAEAAWLYQWLGAEHSRTGLFFDFLVDGANAPRGHGGFLRRAHNTWMTFNLMRPVTAFAAEHSTHVAMHRLLKSSVKLADGVGISKQELTNLHLSGIDEATAARIGREVKAGGAVLQDGVYLPEISKWQDQELAETFRAALIQNTKRAVLTPTRGELPIVMGNPLGQILFQFVSYPLNASQAFVISGLQRRDAAVWLGAMTMIGIGMFGVALEKVIKGEEISLSELAAAGVERSGLPGLLSNFNHMFSRVTGGAVDFNNLVGARTAADKFGPIRDVGGVVPGFAALTEAYKEARRGFRLLNGEEVGDKEIETFVKRFPPLAPLYMAPAREVLEGILK